MEPKLLKELFRHLQEFSFALVMHDDDSVSITHYDLVQPFYHSIDKKNPIYELDFYRHIGRYCKLSEEFILFIQDEISDYDNELICEYQNLSYEFIKKNLRILSYEHLLLNKNLDPEKVNQIYEQYGQFQ